MYDRLIKLSTSLKLGKAGRPFCSTIVYLLARKVAMTLYSEELEKLVNQLVNIPLMIFAFFFAAAVFLLAFLSALSYFVYFCYDFDLAYLKGFPSTLRLTLIVTESVRVSDIGWRC